MVNNTDNSQVFALVAELAQLDGAAPISSWPGLWSGDRRARHRRKRTPRADEIKHGDTSVQPPGSLQRFTAGVFTPSMEDRWPEANEDSLIRHWRKR